jgi:hypothetical protein
MKLRDALFNWLSIELVAKERPDDEAARETVAFFRQILIEDHNVAWIGWEPTNDGRYEVRFRIGEEPEALFRFDAESAEQLMRGLEGDAGCGGQNPDGDEAIPQQSS